MSTRSDNVFNGAQRAWEDPEYDEDDEVRCPDCKKRNCVCDYDDDDE